MGCQKSFLGFRWERHSWNRQVTHQEHHAFRENDQWGRSVEVENAMCHTQYVCTECGAVRDEGECGCEMERAEKCEIRLAYLAETRKDADKLRA